MLFDTYMILEQVTYFNLHNSTVTLLVSTRDHGKKQTKSTEVIHSTQFKCSLGQQMKQTAAFTSVPTPYLYVKRR